MSRSDAIAAYGCDGEGVEREIATVNQRADELGLVFDFDPRLDNPPAAVVQSSQEDSSGTNAADPERAKSTGV
jgi:capsid protein